LLVGGKAIDFALGTAINHVAAQTRAMSICVAAKPVNAAPGYTHPLSISGEGLRPITFNYRMSGAAA